MDIQNFSGDLSTFNGDLLVIGRFQDEEPSQAEQQINTALGGGLSAKVERFHFKGKSTQKVTLDTAGRWSATRVMLLGLGKRARWSGRVIRDAVALVAHEAIASRADEVCLALELNEADGGEATAGFNLGLYTFDTFMTPNPDTPAHKVKTLSFVADLTQGSIARGETLSTAVNLARDLVNEPPNVCTPERLAQVALEMAEFDGVDVKVLERAEIEEAKMGGVIAVSQGATREPRFIHIHYRPQGSSRGSLALIGKGLTFDSGGLSLKPPKSQEMMHIDMGGSAAVLGAMHALVRLQPDVELHGIVGACENMPDGNSYRPSDILTMYNGKTVEVLNTDAEGRLVLADALHYATKLNPDGMVNLATLTGACMVGLGSNYCGLFSDDDEWAETLLKAAKSSGEKMWRLPLDEGLASTLKSKRADIKNIGGPWGGAITAALFLKNFKGDTTWAHLDIAGPTTSDKAQGATPAGGTGFGVLTLIALAESFKS
jgi:leucyl aminopeptidase